ncbi:MAG: hypothetical protein LBG10_07935 [Treponema sp.]|jgi:hypothetical protein|nr:hypothetical protein [Treponema sp.]
MKRNIVMILALGTVCAGLAFAADPYVVQSVTGKVEREVSPGAWEAVEAGAILTPATVINTGLNSTLVLKNGDKTFTIKAMQKGAVENLAAAAGSGSVRISGKISSSTAALRARGTSNTSTASTRASEMVNDPEWTEE